jgi:hypothetical protein
MINRGMDGKSEEKKTLISFIFGLGISILSSRLIQYLAQNTQNPLYFLIFIIYSLPLLVLVGYLGYDKLVLHIFGKYPPKAKIEWFFSIALIITIISVWVWGPIVNNLYPNVPSAVITNSWTPAYLYLLFLIGYFTAYLTSLYYKRFLFEETEDRLKQLLKTHFYSRGFLLMPVFMGIFYDTILSIPMDTYLTTGNIFLALTFSFTGVIIFSAMFYRIRPDIGFFSFFDVEKNFDQFRILRFLKNGPKTKKEIEKAIKNPDKTDLWLDFLIKKKDILFRKNRYELIIK